ncbi:hypothetical protein C8R41DRAFT_771229 [Lentinula lateritia]|uniref:Ubiquitin-like protease family profile domain-containing protein n=1 Tax=Lentinula lateritia TaxID=40482 RepID=A0ABQ8V8W3_9AGAR|nr:hypothetical protein C8R41DRAFT_771229 [Lentinula lateritia]
MIFEEKELNTVQAAAKAGTRRIRDSDIEQTHFDMLIHGGARLTSSVMNAVAAQIQLEAEREGESPNFCVLSSWLGPLVEGVVGEGPVVGTFDMHICQSVKNFDEALLARRKWIVPLCGVKVAHWVLAWVDFGSREIGIFDSIPELQSCFWAEPTLLKIIDHIFARTKRPLVDWRANDCPYSRKIYSPGPLESQMDDWSCGHFTLMALLAIRQGRRLEQVGKSGLNEMRKNAVRMLMNIPILKPALKTSDNDDDNDIVVFVKSRTNVDVDCHSKGKEAEPNHGNTSLNSSVPKSLVPAKRANPSSTSDPDSDAESQPEKKQHSNAKVITRRAKKMSVAERQDYLKDDEWVEQILNEKSVRCAGCKKEIRLGKPFEIKNWKRHRDETCPRITRRKKVRTVQITPTKVQYITKTIKAEPSIMWMFSRMQGVRIASSQVKTKKRVCVHLNGAQYKDYIELTRTRNFGGISSLTIGLTSRRLFPYKTFPLLKSDGPLVLDSAQAEAVPVNGSPFGDVNRWTNHEWQKAKALLSGYARWEVDIAGGFIKSTRCELQTYNSSSVCDSCESVANDESFKRAVRKKRHEASLPKEMRLEKSRLREKHASLTSDRFQQIERRHVKDLISDEILFDIKESLKTGNPQDCFLSLWKHAQKGNLNKHERVVEICASLDDKVRRESSGNPKLIRGIRYTQNVIDFMMTMRSYGHNSHQQYSIFTSVFGGPSSRHLQTLRAKSADALQNPYLIFENVARAKRYYDSISYLGPVIAGSDCTKVKKRMNFSTSFGCHILGTTMPLQMVEVDSAEDINEIVDQVVSEKTLATQARAVIMKVPLPHCPAIVIALLPTAGKETAQEIHAMHMCLVEMAGQLDMHIVALVADGAATELSAQALMDQEQTAQPLIYENPVYGVRLSAPVLKTGPLISVTDAPHARKTARNQPQHGTHTASLGVGYLVNRSLIDVYSLPGSGLQFRDVDNVDKQDDGAARRIFHTNVLDSLVEKKQSHEPSSEPTIQAGFEGTFAYLFVLGSLFEAWMNPTMSIEDRVLAAFRARFWLNFVYHHILGLTKKFPDLYSTKRSFISPPSLRIFNRLCDSLVLLVLAYSEYYPGIPFSIHNISTEFIEHFFGVARQLLPNFSYAELLKIIQHVMVRQRILESGLVNSKQSKDSASGYLFNEISDLRVPSSKPIPPVSITREQIDDLVRVAYNEAVHICRDILSIPAPKTPSPSKQPLLHVARVSAVDSTINGNEFESEPNVEYESDDEPDEDGDDNDGDDSGDELNRPVPEEDEDEDDINIQQRINYAAGITAKNTARYSVLCDDLDDILSQHNLSNVDISLPLPSSTVVPSLASLSGPSQEAGIEFSKILNPCTSKFSVIASLNARKMWQSATVTKSERTVKLSTKFSQTMSMTENPKKMTPKEASHRLRIAQDHNVELQQQQKKKSRQKRWLEAAENINKIVGSVNVLPNLGAKNVTALNPLTPQSFVLMRTAQHIYIGQVLDIYKKGQNSRHGSVATATDLSGLSYLSLRVFLPLGLPIVSSIIHDDSSENSDESGSDDEAASCPQFSCHTPGRSFHLHTHAPIANVLYHLGQDALSGPLNRMELNERSRKRWTVFRKKETKKVLEEVPVLKIKIPARKSSM